MCSFGVFSSLYDRLRVRRVAMLACVTSVLAVSIAAFSQVDIREDVEEMLPDDRAATVEDFNLLRLSPFARRVMINLETPPGHDPQALTAAAGRLSGALSPPFFTKVFSPPGPRAGGELVAGILERLPLLAGGAKLRRWMAGVDRKKIADQLERHYRRLLSPEGLVVKNLLRSDPLELHVNLLETLRFASPVRNVRVEKGQLVSPDGQNALIIAETPVAMTDTRGGREMMDFFRGLVQKVVPPGIDVSFVSGHRYSLANAEVIRSDMWIVLGISSFLILVLFFFVMKSWRGIFVFLVPLSVLCLSALAVSGVYGHVSAITLGFGAVLLGISVDYAIHVYFALREGGAPPSSVVSRVARPVVLGGVTTFGAFGIMLFSSLPGQRQLALFSMVGIACAMLLSLIVLPHLIPPAGKGPGRPEGGVSARARIPRAFVLACWLSILAVCGWMASSVRVSGDLRTVSVIPDDLRSAEERLRTTWGDVRGQAIFFTEGGDLDTALENNDRLFEAIVREIRPLEVTSIAPVLPAPSTQKANWEQWRGYWDGAEGRKVRRLIREEAKKLGFSDHAFSPFFRKLEESPDPIEIENLGSGVLRELVGSLIVTEGGVTRIMTLASDSAHIGDFFEEHGRGLEGVRLVSPGRLQQVLSDTVSSDLARFLVMAALVVTVLLTLLFREGRKVLCALVPVTTGLVVMTGVMGALDFEINIFNIVAAVLIIGLGVDYGIFMVCKEAEGLDHDTERAVLVSGLTTLAGFGALAVARHPALSSIGLTVLIGIGAAMPSALVVIPMLLKEDRR